MKLAFFFKRSLQENKMANIKFFYTSLNSGVTSILALTPKTNQTQYNFI